MPNIVLGNRSVKLYYAEDGVQAVVPVPGNRETHMTVNEISPVDQFNSVVKAWGDASDQPPVWFICNDTSLDTLLRAQWGEADSERPDDWVVDQTTVDIRAAALAQKVQS